MHLFDQRGHTIKAWITIIPLTGAALIALTRVTDYRHHPTDIIAGSLLGLALAWFSYRLYYPPLDHPMAHKAYSPRIPEDEEPFADEGNSQEGLRVGAGNGGMMDVPGDDMEGPDGTLKRPVEGRGQGPIPLRAGPSGSSSGQYSYSDMESGGRN
jgi:hypothetical protein